MKKGFVDIQNNGWMGTDFSAEGLTVEKVKKITCDLIARGTIAYCPTIITTSLDNFKNNLPVIAEAMKDKDIGKHILGIHMEGPFISPEPGAIGAHPKKYILKPDIDIFKQFQEWAEGNIKILTLAPDQPDCIALIRYASNNGVTVSIGHHLASDENMERAVQAGAKLCTHLGNGLPNKIHRHNNPLWWQLSCDDICGLFITDGHHLPDDMIKTALRSKTVYRFIVTSDASSLAGMPSGKYNIFSGLPVVIDDNGRIFSEQSQSLAGSHSTIMECMNYLASLNFLTEDDLWQVGFENPLKVIGKNCDDLLNLNGPDIIFKNGQFFIKK